MSHAKDSKLNLLECVRRIQGQMQAIEAPIEQDADCAKNLHLVAATVGAMNGLTDEIIEAPARSHVADAKLTQAQRTAGVEALLAAIRRYPK